MWLTIMSLSMLSFSALSQQTKLNTFPADDHTLMRLMALYSPPILTQTESFRLPRLKQDLSNKKVVLVGEIHNQFEQHLVQLGVLYSLYAQNPKIGIGVEWIQAHFQPVVDQYLAGEIDELTFLEQTQFVKRWGYDYRMFRPILSFAKRHGIPVYALNAPEEVTDRISANGLESLTVAEKSQIAPKIHPPSEENLMILEEHFTKYVSDPKRIERMVLVKRVWDETMTHNTLKALENPNVDQMLVFTGVNHIINDSGIVSDLTRALPRSQVATISTQTKDQLDKEVTDYVIVSPLLYVAGPNF